MEWRKPKANMPIGLPRLGKEQVRARIHRKDVAAMRPRFPLGVDVAQPSAGCVKVDKIVALLHNGKGGMAPEVFHRGRIGILKDHVPRTPGGE